MDGLHEIVLKLVEVVNSWGYPGIFVLMCLESTVFPIPSEVVMPPAGYLASIGEMNLAVAILAGTLGSVAGASINYGLAIWLGRPFLLKYGRYVLCPPHKFEKVERFFLTHGEIGTFTGRLILGVRHFISLPAGLSRMNLPRFLVLTALGSAIWCGVLAFIGFWLGRVSKNVSPQELQHLFVRYGKGAGVLATLLCILIIGLYIWNHRRKVKAATT